MNILFFHRPLNQYNRHLPLIYVNDTKRELIWCVSLPSILPAGYPATLNFDMESARQTIVADI
jgi:hypothetical protein